MRIQVRNGRPAYDRSSHPDAHKLWYSRGQERAEMPAGHHGRRAALDIALTQEGVPYVWGGQDPSGFDGSGLIIWSYQMVDPNLRFRNYRNEIVNDVTQDELWRYNVMRLELSQARPGDIVFITSDSHRITHGGRSRERSGGSGLLGSAGSWRRGHERSGSPCEGKRENSGNYSTYL